MMNDHDLLIAVSTKLDMVLSSIETLRIEQAKKADRDDVVDHEHRIRVVEAWQWRTAGMLALLQLVTTAGGVWVLTKVFGH